MEKHDIGSSDTALVHKSRNGLDIGEATDQVHNAAASGNQAVKLDGVDHEGNSLRGNNDSFQYTVEMPSLPDDPDRRARAMYSEYTDLLAAEALTVDKSTDDSADEIRDLDSKL